jgi:hypothetical protein
MSALPSAVSYTQGSPSLPPNARAIDVVLRPTNGATFGENATITFDFNNAGFIDPASIYLRYKYAFTNLVSAEMKGVPVYTPFQTLRAYVGSNQVETISQYNQVAHMLVNLTHDVAQKYGLQPGYGYFNSTGVPTLEQLDGRTLSSVTANETGTFSAPLPCMFSNCDKFLPAFAMPQLRVELVVSTLTDMFKSSPVAVPTGIVLSNLELCYSQIDMGADVEAMVRSSGLTHIKTHSFVNTASTLNSGTSGQVALVYNQRLASIRSAFLFMSQTLAGTNNGEFDSVDITSNNGSFWLTIAGKSYPQTPLSTSQNKAGIFQALRGAVGSIYSKDNCCAINAVEWNYVSGATTTSQAPGKFIVGVDLETIAHDYIMSGVSSQNSAITANIQLGTATATGHNVHLIMDYDALLEIDFASGLASVKM